MTWAAPSTNGCSAARQRGERHRVPTMAFEAALVRVLVAAFAPRALMLSAHDIALGGLLVTAAEMAIASAPFDVECARRTRARSAASCFSEMGGVVVEVGDASWEEFTARLEAALRAACRESAVP